MGKFTLKTSLPIVLAVLLAISALVVAVRNDLFTAAVWRQHASRPHIQVNAAAISTINKPITITKTGVVQSAAVVPVNIETAGYVSEIYVTEGQQVKAGQPLIKIQAVAGSANDSDSSGTTASNATQASKPAQDQYDKALAEYNRYQKLYDLGAISRVQLENAKSRLEAAQAGLAASQGSRPAPPAHVSAVSGTATIEAPIAGTVTGVTIAPGKMVQAGQQLLSLGSGQAVEMVVRLEQPDLYLVHLGTPAVIAAGKQTVAGQVSSIQPIIEANQIAAFLAHIKLTNSLADALTPGMTATVRLDTGNSVPVLAVHSAAVIQDERGQKFIYIADNGKAVRQPVSTGETIGDFIEITSDISSTALVITSNLTEINNGDAIAVQ